MDGRLRNETNPSHRKSLESRRAAIDGLVANWPQKSPTLPDEFRERIKFAHAWKSSKRMAALIFWMRDNPFDGDEFIVAWLEQWRKVDKHLRNFECHRRRKYQLWRKEFYRQFAVRLRRQFKTFRVTKLDVEEMAALPPDEDPEAIIAAIRYNNRLASPGLLTAILKEFGPEFASDEVVLNPPEPLEVV